MPKVWKSLVYHKRNVFSAKSLHAGLTYGVPLPMPTTMAGSNSRGDYPSTCFEVAFSRVTLLYVIPSAFVRSRLVVSTKVAASRPTFSNFNQVTSSRLSIHALPLAAALMSFPGPMSKRPPLATGRSREILKPHKVGSVISRCWTLNTVRHPTIDCRPDERRPQKQQRNCGSAPPQPQDQCKDHLA